LAKNAEKCAHRRKSPFKAKVKKGMGMGNGRWEEDEVAGGGGIGMQKEKKGKGMKGQEEGKARLEIMGKKIGGMMELEMG
jgi:hypothetical protein